MDEIIDIRDLISRFEELESEREALQEELAAALDRDQTGPEQIDAHRALTEWQEEWGEEFMELTVLLTELAGYGGDEQWRGDWYPLLLIPEGAFTDYVQDMVVDCGDLPAEIPSYIEIDWESTASNVRHDYSEVVYGGDTYLYR